MSVNLANPTELMGALLKGEEVSTDPTQEASSEEESTEVEEPQGPDAEEILDEWSKEEPAEEPTTNATSEDDEKSTETGTEFIKAGGKKIKVDYTNRSKIKKAYELAAGMRKFQQERDKVIVEKKEQAQELTESRELWSKIESAADAGDYNTLMKIMTKGKTDFDSFLNKRLEKMRLREDASEEEVEKMDLFDEISNLKSELARVTADVTDKSAKAEVAREKAEVKSLQARIDPVFSKYRFHGKLDDPDAEQHLDEMLWAKVINNLEEYEDIDTETINNEFRKASTVLNRIVAKQTDKQIKKTSKERKRVAKETAQVQQVRGYIDGNIKQEAASKIRSGDLTGVLSNWSKFGKLFE